MVTEIKFLSLWCGVFYAASVDISIRIWNSPSVLRLYIHFEFHANESIFFMCHPCNWKLWSAKCHTIKLDNWKFSRLTNEEHRITEREKKIPNYFSSYRINMTILLLLIPRKWLWKEIEHFRVYITKNKHGITCCVSRASFILELIKSSCYGSK